jgi:hypothetical protein
MSTSPEATPSSSTGSGTPGSGTTASSTTGTGPTDTTSGYDNATGTGTSRQCRIRRC